MESATPLPSDADPIIGQLITGRYRVKGRIGEGGMGTVYLAVHEAIEKKVALKVLNREYSANREVVERFKQEAVSASRIKHPNVIDVFDFGQLDDGSCFIAMELLEGQDLGELLSMRGHVDPIDAIRILLQVAKALGLAHSRGVVHRDLKPENVFLQNTPEGERIVKIVDFGIAQLRGKEEVSPEGAVRRRRLTKTGMIFGTPEYMAPEQARGLDVDHRTDIYASGIILYELLTGGVPFVGESFLEVLNQHVLDPLPALRKYKPDLAISAELEAVVRRMLEKKPDDRFLNMKEVTTALMATPEGRALRAQLSSSSGLGAEFDIATSLMSTEATVDGSGRKRSAKTESGHPPPIPESGREVPTSMLGSRDRTPPGRELGIDREPRASSLPLIFGVATLALLAVAAGGVYLALRPNAAVVPAEGKAHAAPSTPAESPEALSSAPATPSNPAEPAAPAVAPSAGVPSAPSTAAPPASAAAASKTVRLSIVTDPTGAVVHKDGFQVCDASPCELEVSADAAVTLVARKGTQSGQAKVLAHKDQTVSIALRAPVKKAPAEKKLCEVTVDGLKILRPCE